MSLLLIGFDDLKIEIFAPILGDTFKKKQMMTFMQWLILAFPLLELLTLIQLGVATSALFAIFYVVATFMLGVAVLRYQGFSMVNQLRAQQLQGIPIGARLMKDDMAIGFAGILLMIPGMISDLAALFVLFGPLRRRLASWLGLRGGDEQHDQPSQHQPQQQSPQTNTIEGEYQRVD